MNKVYKLSPSKLNLFKECERCFWLDLNGVWRRPMGVFPSLPAGMDRILKVHFNRFMEKGKLPPELCENSECHNMKLFSDSEKLKIWQDSRKGVSFTDKDGNVLHGAVDNLLVNGKKLIVLDYKTRGYPIKDDTAGHYQLQLDVYNLLLRKNGYSTEDFAFLLFYVPKEVMATGEVLFDTELVRMKIDASRGMKVWRDAIKLLNEDCPKKRCEWCCNVG